MLGAWDLEDEFSRVIINGKKLYSVEHVTPKRRTIEQLAEGLDPCYTVKSKGTARLTWSEMDCMLHGAAFEVRNRAPTLTKFSEQYYISRKICATAQILRRDGCVEQPMQGGIASYDRFGKNTARPDHPRSQHAETGATIAIIAIVARFY